MKTINLGHAKICLVDDHIVLFEANPDVVIGSEEAQAFYDKSGSMLMVTTACLSTVGTSINCCDLKFSR